MKIGLLMVNEENDILERVLTENDRIFDKLYVLDGTVPNDVSYRICVATGKLAGYWTDAELPRPPYPEGTTCGYRGFIHGKAVAENGPDHWFVELHGDEIWDHTVEEVTAAWPTADGFGLRLPFFFPREPWRDDVHPLDQLRWHMVPGWPEFRLYHGSKDVQWDPEQHFNTQPSGLRNVVWTGYTIRHFPYRAPQVQRARAAIHQRTGFDPGNYQHIVNEDAVYWTDAMIQGAVCEHHTEAVCA